MRFSCLTLGQLLNNAGPVVAKCCTTIERPFRAKQAQLCLRTGTVTSHKGNLGHLPNDITSALLQGCFSLFLQ